MQTLRLVISIAQVVVVILFIITVLLQQKGVGLGSAFGGDSVYTTRRGPEKFIFNSCIVLATLFLGLGLATIFLQ